MAPRTTEDVVAAGRSTWDAHQALNARREELGEVRYLAEVRKLLGDERYVDWLEGYALARRSRPEEEGIVAKSKAPAFEFRGRLTSVDAKAPKEKTDWNGTRLEGGALVITVEVPRPRLPEAPKKVYPLTNKRPADPGPEPTFAAPAQEEGETDAAYKKRVKAAEKEFRSKSYSTWKYKADDRVRWDAALEKHNQEVAKYRSAADRVAAEFAAYAQMAGVGAVIQGLEVRIALTPDGNSLRKYLPGFSPLMLGAPGEPAGELDLQDEPEDDLEEEGDEGGYVDDDEEADGVEAAG